MFQCLTFKNNGQLEWEVGSNRVIQVCLHGLLALLHAGSSDSLQMPVASCNVMVHNGDAVPNNVPALLSCAVPCSMRDIAMGLESSQLSSSMLRNNYFKLSLLCGPVRTLPSL